jgi:putative holliday junction resolvase
MKILALDLGDKWVGSAISDEIGITCRPYKTVKREELNSFLSQILSEENIGKVIVGHPKTLGGTDSIQTQKIAEEKEVLEKKFGMLDGTQIKWILWDERLSSKRAELTQGKKSYKDKDAKIESHSIAAAFILQSYLDYIALNVSL